MASVVLKTLSILLGLFFIFVGILKVTPKLSKDMHKDIKKNFIQYAKVFPLSQQIGFKVSAKWYRRVVGGMELACGLTLLLVPGILKEVANALLLCLTITSVYNHYAVHDRLERTAPALVFTFMLICRMIIFLQTTRFLRRRATEAGVIEAEYDAAGDYKNKGE